MEIMVSILTTAYNHAPYIAQALESFLKQKTEFPFEIIVHDDASTDGTAAIIQEYAEKYPDVIIPVFQRENQYSQGTNVYSFMVPLVRGKYIAQCEGDDYWCDAYKLQKQVKYMEAHPDCSFCFGNSYNVDLNSKIISKRTPVMKSREFTSREMIGASEEFLATCTTMYRTEQQKNFPSWLLAGEVGDVPLRNYLMTLGYAYGFEERFGCYRIMTPGSWSERMRADYKTATSSVIKANDAYIAYYHQFDRYTKYAFHDELMPNLYKRVIRKANLERKYAVMKTEPYRDYYKKLKWKRKLWLFLNYYAHWLTVCYMKLKKIYISRNEEKLW